MASVTTHRSAPPAGADRPAPSTVAAELEGVLRTMLGDPLPVRFELWDGSAIGADRSTGIVRVNSPNALRRLLWMPTELGVGRAYVAGDLDVAGSLPAVLAVLRGRVAERRIPWAAALASAGRAAAHLHALGPPLAPPEEEARLHGRRHSRTRDARAVTHHYDVGNDFYRLVLGPTMTYSCGRFADASASLEMAQTAKHDLVCRKLGLHEHHGARLLDVGCGWGSMAIHAATQYGANVVGITISPSQAGLARERVAAAGVSDLVEIRLQDYRDVHGEQFDAISSIGMSEHVGSTQLDQYFSVLRALLVPTGRLLNHAISSVGGSRMSRWSFVGRYVFPDGELIDVGDVTLSMERAGFEVRDVESLREHYGRTLRAWVGNLEEHWDDAVALVGPRRARVWLLYMAASALAFEDGHIAIHQVLGVAPDSRGASGMPLTRRDWN